MRVNLTIILIVFTCMLGYGNDNSDSLIIEGKTLFRNNCKACHNIDKKLVGPALSKVYERRDSAWIYDFIIGSQSMIANGDSTSIALYNQFNQVIMPDQKLEIEEIDIILAYIKSVDNNTSTVNKNPISRPEIAPISYSNSFRFSNYVFWIPFTIFVILGICVLYFMTHYYELVEDFLSKNK